MYCVYIYVKPRTQIDVTSKLNIFFNHTLEINNAVFTNYVGMTMFCVISDATTASNNVEGLSYIT